MGKNKLTPEKKAEKLAKQAEQKAIVDNLKSKVDDFKKEFDVVVMPSYDWKELNENVYNDLKKIVTVLGGFMYNNPYHEGSDQYGFIIARKEINKTELKTIKTLAIELADNDLILEEVFEEL